MKDITCLVTGANSGIGLAMAKGLAQTGATVVMLCRDKARGQKARIDIISESNNPNVDLMVADLSSIEEVKQFAREFQSRYDALHVLANLAGIAYPKRGISADGLEINFATNILGPFILTELLLDLLIHSGPSTIINVSGEAHRTGQIHFNDLQLKKKFTLAASKGQAAMARVMWTSELAHRLHRTSVTANSFCPGRTRTRLHRHFPAPIRWGLNFLDRIYGKKPEENMKPVLDFVLNAGLNGTSGKYLVEGEIGAPIPLSLYRGMGKRLWRTCERMAGMEGSAKQVISKAIQYSNRM